MLAVNENDIAQIEYQIQADIDPVARCMTQHANTTLESSLKQRQRVHKEPDPQSSEFDYDEDFCLFAEWSQSNLLRIIRPQQ